MTILNNVLPFIGAALLLAVLITLIAGRLVKESKLRFLAVAVLLLMGLFLPLNGLSAVQWLRSVVGDLSVLSFVLFAHILLRRLFFYDLLKPLELKNLLLGIALLGVVFYPLALGWGRFDPYQLGYDSLIIPLALCSVSVALWLSAQRALAVVLLSPLLAFNLLLLESTNVWDYLIDPVLFVYACVQLIKTRVWPRLVGARV